MLRVRCLCSMWQNHSRHQFVRRFVSRITENVED